MTKGNEETGLQASIVEALAGVGIKATRVHCGGVRVRRGYMALAKAGTPDLLLELYRTSWLETKTPKGGFKPAQLPRHAELRRSGSRVAVVRSREEALAVALEWRREDDALRALEADRAALRRAGLD